MTGNPDNWGPRVLRASHARLLEALKTTKRSHYSCDDRWYSCPKSEEGCIDERAGNDCNCGADEFNARIDAIAAAEEFPESTKRWRHKKRGSTYVEIGRGRLQISRPVEDMEPVVIYRSEHDRSIWVRPVSEFEDGRFEAIAAAEGSGE